MPQSIIGIIMLVSLLQNSATAINVAIKLIQFITSLELFL